MMFRSTNRYLAELFPEQHSGEEVGRALLPAKDGDGDKEHKQPAEHEEQRVPGQFADHSDCGILGAMGSVFTDISWIQ